MCGVFPKAIHFADRTSPHLQSIDTDIQLLATQAITPFNVYLQALPIDDTQSDHTINRQYCSHCEHLETSYTNCTDSQFPESAQATRRNCTECLNRSDFRLAVEKTRCRMVYGFVKFIPGQASRKISVLLCQLWKNEVINNLNF